MMNQFLILDFEGDVSWQFINEKYNFGSFKGGIMGFFYKIGDFLEWIFRGNRF